MKSNTIKPIMRVFLISFILFFSLSGFSQQYNNDGDTIFASSMIHEIRFNFYHPAYYDSLTLSYTTDIDYVCNMVFDGVAFDSIGLKFKGNSSYNILSQKKSMKVDMDHVIANQDIDDLGKFNLNNLYHDPTGLREKILADFLNKHQMPAPRVTYAKVYYNNVYWGLYTLVEEVNKDFIDGWFNDKRGNLFKGDPSGDLKWINGSPSSYYNKYELHTNEIQNDWTDLVTFIDKVNNYPVSGIRDTLDRYLYVTEFLRHQAICDIFVSLDSYIGSRHNYYIYHDSLINRFRWIMWDINSCFGVFNQSMTVAQMENLSPFYLGTPNVDRPLAYRLMQDPASQLELTYWMCVFLQPDQFSNTNLDPIIDSLSDRIRADIYADPNYTYTDQQFEDNRTMTVVADMKNYPGLKPFITARRNSLMTSLAPFGCYLGMEEGSGELAFSVFPNPAETGISISCPREYSKVEIYNSIGELVSSSGQSAVISIEALSSGIYLLVLRDNAGNRIGTTRIIKE